MRPFQFDRADEPTSLYPLDQQPIQEPQSIREAMQALFMAWYNFARKNEALEGQTAAMASKLTDHVWTIKELIDGAAKALPT